MSKDKSIKKASLKQLEQELDRRKKAKINQLRQEISDRNNEIQSLGGAVAQETVIESLTMPTSRKTVAKVKKSMAKTRVINETSLADLLVSIGKEETATTTKEYLSALQQRGWKTSSPKPYYVVAAALAAQEKKKVFRRISKGSYVLNKSE